MVVAQCDGAAFGWSGGLGPGTVIMSLVGAFYYLRVIKVMYFDPPLTVSTVSADTHVKAVLAVNGGLVLVLGVLPDGLMGLCGDAVVKALGT